MYVYTAFDVSYMETSRISNECLTLFYIMSFKIKSKLEVFLNNLFYHCYSHFYWKRKHHKGSKITNRLFYADKQLCFKTANKNIRRTTKWPISKPSIFL